jgi:hypothetical protein
VDRYSIDDDPGELVGHLARPGCPSRIGVGLARCGSAREARPSRRAARPRHRARRGLDGPGGGRPGPRPSGGGRGAGGDRQDGAARRGLPPRRAVRRARPRGSRRSRAGGRSRSHRCSRRCPPAPAPSSTPPSRSWRRPPTAQYWVVHDLQSALETAAARTPLSSPSTTCSGPTTPPWPRCRALVPAWRSCRSSGCSRAHRIPPPDGDRVVTRLERDGAVRVRLTGWPRRRSRAVLRDQLGAEPGPTLVALARGRRATRSCWSSCCGGCGRTAGCSRAGCAEVLGDRPSRRLPRWWPSGSPRCPPPRSRSSASRRAAAALLRRAAGRRAPAAPVDADGPLERPLHADLLTAAEDCSASGTTCSARRCWRRCRRRCGGRCSGTWWRCCCERGAAPGRGGAPARRQRRARGPGGGRHPPRRGPEHRRSDAVAAADLSARALALLPRGAISIAACSPPRPSRCCTAARRSDGRPWRWPTASSPPCSPARGGRRAAEPVGHDDPPDAGADRGEPPRARAAGPAAAAARPAPRVAGVQPRRGRRTGARDRGRGVRAAAGRGHRGRGDAGGGGPGAGAGGQRPRGLRAGARAPRGPPAPVPHPRPGAVRRGPRVPPGVDAGRAGAGRRRAGDRDRRRGVRAAGARRAPAHRLDPVRRHAPAGGR